MDTTSAATAAEDQAGSGRLDSSASDAALSPISKATSLIFARSAWREWWEDLKRFLSSFRTNITRATIPCCECSTTSKAITNIDPHLLNSNIPNYPPFKGKEVSQQSEGPSCPLLVYLHLASVSLLNKNNIFEIDHCYEHIEDE